MTSESSTNLYQEVKGGDNGSSPPPPPPPTNRTLNFSIAKIMEPDPKNKNMTKKIIIKL